ncbi:DUF2277 family protein [Rhizobium leguminosarum]|nr:DUF2277 domain-containing protein [Rhizobium leguminosarum]
MCRNIKPLFNFDPPATNEETPDGRRSLRAWRARRSSRTI